MKGIVKFYDIRKGYGFIRGNDGCTIFIHKTAIPFFDIFLTPGDIMEYHVSNTKKRLIVVDVKRI